MSGYDFRKGQGILPALEAPKSLRRPIFLLGQSARCHGCARAGHGGEGQQYGLGAMTTAKPRPPLAAGEMRAYPVLPLRDFVVFPHMIATLFAGRKKSILALEEVMRSDTFI